MDTVLICVSPEADFALYELWHQQFRGREWEGFVLPVTELSRAELPTVAAAVAHATDWPDEHLAEWLGLIRRAIGPRKRLLALLPRPPSSYAPEIQALWTRALGYGAKIGEAVTIVEEMIAGRI